ncbi:hypothetical protein FQR65_LT03998 [Abscondita terminalis]|nr:hypothetical protein FQR65_LT03998 [Abscondita terminalis]
MNKKTVPRARASSSGSLTEYLKRKRNTEELAEDLNTWEAEILEEAKKKSCKTIRTPTKTNHKEKDKTTEKTPTEQTVTEITQIRSGKEENFEATEQEKIDMEDIKKMIEEMKKEFLKSHAELKAEVNKGNDGIKQELKKCQEEIKLLKEELAQKEYEWKEELARRDQKWEEELNSNLLEISSHVAVIIKDRAPTIVRPSIQLYFEDVRS